jgi:uncharacterized protein YcbX
MATITHLSIYPVKSCAGITLQQAVLTAAGLSTGTVADREWMIVDQAGLFLTQREHPRMALIQPVIMDAALMLSAPGQLPFSLPLDHDPLASTRMVGIWDDQVEAADCGDAAARWCSAVLNVPCRLVRFGLAARRVTSGKWTGGEGVPTRFADGYPILLLGAASLADINRHMAAAGRAALPMDRFRPNVVVGGLEAFEEDYVAEFTAGEAVLQPVKPCPRCPIPSIDQATGERGPDPLDVLQAFRRKQQLDDAVCVGMNCIVAGGAGTVLTVGQAVSGHLAFD